MDIVVEADFITTTLECSLFILLAMTSFAFHKSSPLINLDNNSTFNITETAMGVSCGTQYDCEAEYPRAVLRWVSLFHLEF